MVVIQEQASWMTQNGNITINFGVFDIEITVYGQNISKI